MNVLGKTSNVNQSLKSGSQVDKKHFSWIKKFTWIQINDLTSNLNLCFLELIAKISKQNVHENISLGLFRLGKFLEGFLQKMQYLWVNRKVYRIMPSKCIFSWEFCYNSRQEGDRPSRLRPQRPPSESLVSHFSKARFTLILSRGGGGLKKRRGW